MDTRFNGGRGALLCNKCKVIIREPLDPHGVPKSRLKKRVYCAQCIKERLNKTSR